LPKVVQVHKGLSAGVGFFKIKAFAKILRAGLSDFIGRALLAENLGIFGVKGFLLFEKNLPNKALSRPAFGSGDAARFSRFWVLVKLGCVCKVGGQLTQAVERCQDDEAFLLSTSAPGRRGLPQISALFFALAVVFLGRTPGITKGG